MGMPTVWVRTSFEASGFEVAIAPISLLPYNYTKQPKQDSYFVNVSSLKPSPATTVNL
jgi:hypothetical protein